MIDYLTVVRYELILIFMVGGSSGILVHKIVQQWTTSRDFWEPIFGHQMLRSSLPL